MSHLRVTTLAALLMLTPISANAQAYNARIRTSLSSVYKILDEALVTPCSERLCRLNIKPFDVSVKSSRGPRQRIRFTEAKIANPAIESNEGAAPLSASPVARPILLRGISISDGSPIAGTIFRDGAEPVFEVIVPTNRRIDPTPEGYSLLSSPLSSLQKANATNARAQAPSTWALQSKFCSTIHPVTDQGSPRPSPQRSYADVSSQATYNAIYLGTDYDTQFPGKAKCRSNSSCQNKIVSIVHQASVLYERQLGYALEVGRQFGPTDHGRDTLSDLVIDGFQQYNFNNRYQFVHTGFNFESNQIDLFQLFTGRKMSQDVIGVAYVGTICRNDQSRFADSVVQFVNNTLNPITLAHEIGHTLGASHTASGIMRPNLGSSPPRSFASDSLLSISGHLAQWYGECRQGTSSGHANPAPTPNTGGSSNPFAGKPVTVTLSAASPSPKTVMLSATVSSLRPDCSLRIRAANTTKAAPRGSIVLERVPSDLTTSAAGSAATRVLPNPSKNTNIYFVAEHTCTDGTILEVSSVARLNPNRIRGVRKKARSKRSWITALTRSLQ